jgi:ribonuclease E
MSKRIIVDGVYESNIRVATVSEQNDINTFEYSIPNKQNLKGNIYVAVITRVEPALQAAFIDYGNGQGGFLPFSEINPIYYKKFGKLKFEKISLKSIDSISLDWKEDYTKEEPEEINAIVDIERLKQELTSEQADDNQIEEIDEKHHETEKVTEQIQDVIKKGQLLLVQATKEERGIKCASFTTYISLLGRYCIFLPHRPDSNGISKKILNIEYRKQLRKLIKLFSEFTSNSSSIIRTAANKKTLQEIKSDYIYLISKWNWICEVANSVKSACLLHVEEDILQKVVRDIADHAVSNITVQGEDSYKKLLNTAKEIAPGLVGKISLYQEDIPIFTKFRLEEKIINLYQPIVDLRSGGYIVINPAEGMTLIDVNSGKSNVHYNIEDMALKTNLEAAIEIAKQLNLREISGLIVIDFIDMNSNENNLLVKKVLEKACFKDNAKVHFGSISKFGLLEMSRQRLKSSFLELNSRMCECCLGKGVVRNTDSNDFLILRTIESEITLNKSDLSGINVYANPNVVFTILNNKKVEISYLEKKYEVKINFLPEKTKQLDQFSIEKIFPKAQVN